MQLEDLLLNCKGKQLVSVYIEDTKIGSGITGPADALYQYLKMVVAKSTVLSIEACTDVLKVCVEFDEEG